MHVQAEMQINEPEGEFFEEALKRVSIQAFDALVSCGVRDLAGLLCLTAENLRQRGLSPKITAELMDIKHQYKEQATRADLGNIEIHQIGEGGQEKCCEEMGGGISAQQNATPIPTDLLENLPKRARNFLYNEKIYTCEGLLDLRDEDLFSVVGLGRITIYEIAQLIKKVKDKTSNSGQISCEPWPSDPANWSVLSQSLLDVFRISPPLLNVISDVDQPTIDTLELSTSDISCLREIVFGPEDPIDFLFYVSTGYLAQTNISEEAFFEILKRLANTCCDTKRSKMLTFDNNISNLAIYADIQIELFGKYRVPQFNCPDYVAIRKNGADITWGELGNVSEKLLIEKLGLTIKGLNTAKYIWKLKEYAISIQNAIQNGLPLEAYCDFDHLLDAYVSTVVSNQREHTVLKGRLGYLDGRRWTLEELGHHENLTRERIRQIEKKLMPLLESPVRLEKLMFLWLEVDEALAFGGGVACVAEIALLLSRRWGWVTRPSDEELASLVSLSANYEVVWTHPIRFIQPHHECVNCTEIGPMVAKAVENNANGTLSFTEVRAIMQKFCQGRSCRKTPENLIFSDGYIHFLDDAIDEIVADESALYTQFAWGLKYGMSRTALVETIISNYGRAMHFKEVHAEVNKNRPAHSQLSDRAIYGHLERSQALILWGPGTFIHKELISIPENLIAEIKRNILTRLRKNDIPYLSITGIFEEYKDLLLQKGIPTVHALYSCMRILNDQDLDCPDYPYVLRRESEGLRLPIQLVLELFVLEQEGIVTFDQIKQYAIEKLCMNEAVVMANYINNIPNLLKINSKECVHVRVLGVDKKQLVSITDHLSKLLNNFEHVSVQKLFNEKKVSCSLVGISTPRLLYSLIQNLYFDLFDLSRFPSIRRISAVADENKPAGITIEVLNFIKDKNLPCSFAELYQHFVDELGYEQNTIRFVHYSYKSLLRYSEGVIVHLDTLEWTEHKQAALEMLAIYHLTERESAGKVYGLISHLYDYVYDKLPELPNNISWTPTLIGELLSREGKYRVLGTYRNAFVSIPGPIGIESLDDLLYHILDSEYDGASNIDKFVLDLRDAGILKKNLTTMMLGVDSRVVIDGNIVQLARLRNHAKRT